MRQQSGNGQKHLFMYLSFRITELE